MVLKNLAKNFKPNFLGYDGRYFLKNYNVLSAMPSFGDPQSSILKKERK